MMGAQFGRGFSDGMPKVLKNQGKNGSNQLIEKQQVWRLGAGRAGFDPHPPASRPAQPAARDAGGGARAIFPCAPACDPSTRNKAACGRGAGA